MTIRIAHMSDLDECVTIDAPNFNILDGKSVEIISYI